MIGGIMLENRRFNKTTHENRKEFLISNIIYKSEGKVDRDLAEYIVEQIDLKKQYFIEVIERGVVCEDNIEESRDHNGNLSRVEFRRFIPIEGDRTNCLAYININYVYRTVDESNGDVGFGTHDIEYNLIVREGR